MINLQRLNYLKESNSNDSIQFVAKYILSKIQRDKSEFSNYANEEDWLELDQFLNSIDIKKRSKMRSPIFLFNISKFEKNTHHCIFKK